MGHALKTFFGAVIGLLVTFVVLLIAIEVALHFIMGEPQVNLSVLIALVGTLALFAWNAYRRQTRVV
ncbi:hypothetical protein [Flaviflexus massiliensis]|uniref:hypothetical protein n=1 Tax=Flaviflexus massiliensis TaxID=1522309 RepID=UPI0006D598CD|nr:hypothetical protein [Flaviflexus massiliensis]